MKMVQGVSKMLKGSGVDFIFGIADEALAATLEKLQVIFEVEEAMEKAIRGGAPVDEIKAIIARKKPKK
jgi:hypothetical protein